MQSIVEILQTSHLSATEIAARAKLPPDRVRAILEGSPISLSELRALSKGLNISIENLLAGSLLVDREQDYSALFRKEPTVGVDQFPPTMEHIAAFIETALSILPRRSSLPGWLSNFYAKEETFLEAHRLAHQFRAELLPDRLDDPLNDLPSILESLGGAIVSILGKSRYEGASVATDGYGFIFLSPRFKGRMLFTLAHELGHLLFHHSAKGGATFDLASSIGFGRKPSKSEAFVNAFAAVLLLPDRGIGQMLKVARQQMQITSPNIGDVEINLLARFYGVSFDVAAIRCEQLELLPKGGAAALSKYVKAEFGSAEQRADSLSLPKRSPIEFPKLSPTLMRALIPRLEGGEISGGWVASRLGVTVSDIFEARGQCERENETRH